MDIMERIDIMKECGLSSEQEHKDLCAVVRLCKDEFGIALTEENAGVMITHIGAALRRVRTGEAVEPLDPEVYAQAAEEPEYERAQKIVARLLETLTAALPEEERQFFLVHVVQVLSQLES